MALYVVLKLSIGVKTHLRRQHFLNAAGDSNLDDLRFGHDRAVRNRGEASGTATLRALVGACTELSCANTYNRNT